MKKLIFLSVAMLVSANSFAKVTEVQTGSDFKTKSKSGVSLLKIWGEGCGACRMSEAPFEALSSQYPKVKFFSLDIRKDDAGVTRGVQNIPVFILFEDGVEKERQVGYGEEKLKSFIQSHSASAGAKKDADMPAKKTMKSKKAMPVVSATETKDDAAQVVKPAKEMRMKKGKKVAAPVVVAEEDMLVAATEEPAKKMMTKKMKKSTKMGQQGS
jgi:thiol-disulfide isomerase/thioredoxin